MNAGSRLVTLDLDMNAMARFEALRRTLYPPERNHVPAHVMLFHRLPAEADAMLREDLALVVASVPRFGVTIGAPYSLGGGVAYPLEAAELLALRARLAATWEPWLIPQDRSRYSPHIVVQNKVAAPVARRCLADLREGFVPSTAVAVGLTLFTYLGGTWHEPLRFAFKTE